MRPGTGPKEEWHTTAGPDVVDVADWAAPPLGSAKGRRQASNGRLSTLSAGPAAGDSIALVPGVYRVEGRTSP